MAEIEKHPFEPFLPLGAKVLFLGSFPPQKKRWSIDFFYPNFINDFWRICGLLFYDDRNHFILPGAKSFDKDRIMKVININLGKYDHLIEEYKSSLDENGRVTVVDGMTDDSIAGVDE